MMLGQMLAGELQHEAANTRKVLALIPADKADWQPHPKSFSLGKLAVHVADMHSWVGMTVNTSELDFAAGDHTPKPFTSADDLVARLDANVAEGMTALAAAPDDGMNDMWTLRVGPQVIMALPRAQMLRSMVFNHIVHHRAQLTVYLRMLDIPIPGLYGPSADERR